MSFGQFFSILRARWKISLLVLLVIVGAVFAISLALPEKYKATASVVLDPKPDPVSSMLYGSGASPAYVSTEINVLESERVAARVGQAIGLGNQPSMRQQWMNATQGKGDMAVWLGNLLKQGLEVKPARESNVLTVTYTSGDPAFSAALANAFVQAYIDTHLELRTDPAKHYSDFFDARSRQARDRLEAAQSKLSAFQKEKGLVVTNERLDIENARLNELSSQLVAIQAVTSESRSRQTQAGRAPESMADIINHPNVAGLRTELLRQETLLQEVSPRLGSNNPQVIEMNSKIASLRSKIQQETQRIMSSVTINNTINATRETEIRAALEAQRVKLLQMKALRDDAAVLERDVQGAQTAYDAIQSRLMATSLESQATQSSVHVLTRASEPTSPSSPNILLNTLIATCAGLLLSVIAAFVMEFFDSRVRTIDDLTVRLNLPVLGILPRPDRRGLFGRPRLSPMQRRVMGRLPSPSPKGA